MNQFLLFIAKACWECNADLSDFVASFPTLMEAKDATWDIDGFDKESDVPVVIKYDGVSFKPVATWCGSFAPGIRPEWGWAAL